MIDSIEGLCKKVLGYNPQADVDLLRKAYYFAEKHHEGQKRASGEPYITHPLAVASILAQLKVDLATITAGLLHDVVEDTSATIEDIRREFGEEIELLVEGATKIARINFQSDSHHINTQAENFRKFVLALAQDIRVLLLKMADRLHNMRTIKHISLESSRRRVALETLEIYAPLAERIGLRILQEELEDLCFEVLHEPIHNSITQYIDQFHKADQKTINVIIDDLLKTLENGGVKAEIFGRKKRPYAIWIKLQRKNLNLEQLSDIIAFRVLVKSVADCYQALGLIHSEYFVIPGKFKDYISTPKANNYQSLHTYVVTASKHQIEVQIRTFSMQEVAEYGVAAHWQYKQGVSVKDGKQYQWIRELLGVLDESPGSVEFLNHTRLEIFKDQVFCRTPHGHLHAFPKGATVIDFAYQVHSEIGNHCKAAKINGRHMPLRTELKDQDQVEIITSPSQTPSASWERFVVTSKAKAHIRRFIRAKRRLQFGNLGRAILWKELKELHYSINEKELSSIAHHFNLDAPEDLCACIGEGVISVSEIIRFVAPDIQLRQGRDLRETQKKSVVIQGLIPGLAVHYAGCCHPLPGEKIIGIVTKGKGITIHTQNCGLLENLEKENREFLKVTWGKTEDDLFVGRLFVSLRNEVGSLGGLSNIVGEHGGNIFNFKITRRNEEFFDLLIDIHVSNIKHLETIIAALQLSKLCDFVERR